MKNILIYNIFLILKLCVCQRLVWSQINSDILMLISKLYIHNFVARYNFNNFVYFVHSIRDALYFINSYSLSLKYRRSSLFHADTSLCSVFVFYAVSWYSCKMVYTALVKPFNSNIIYSLWKFLALYTHTHPYAYTPVPYSYSTSSPIYVFIQSYLPLLQPHTRLPWHCLTYLPLPVPYSMPLYVIYSYLPQVYNLPARQPTSGLLSSPSKRVIFSY